MLACYNYFVAYSLSNMHSEHKRLYKYITSGRNPMLFSHESDNKKMTAWSNNAKTTGHVCRPNFNTGSLSPQRASFKKLLYTLYKYQLFSYFYSNKDTSDISHCANINY